jgi:hypothetical protein
VKRKPLTQKELDRIAQKHRAILIPYLIEAAKKGVVADWDITFVGNAMRVTVLVNTGNVAHMDVNYTKQLTSLRRILKKRKL